MDQLGLLSKRDIFGVILPGTIVVLTITFVTMGTLNLWGTPIDLKNLKDQQFLLSLLLFVASYLAGSLLRLFAADDVDKESGKNALKAWEKVFRAKFEKNAAEYNNCYTELAMGNEVANVPEGFDDWLWRVDQFSFAAWQNRKWQTLGFHAMLNFYRENYKAGMWSGKPFPRSHKSFFNYCKLVITKNNKELTDEVNIAEGITRFFSGTVQALQISSWLLVFFLLSHALFAFVVWLLQLPLPTDILRWQLQGFYFCLAAILVLVAFWMQQRIVSRFRFLRLKEVETVYSAFYLCYETPAKKRTEPPVNQT